MVQLRRRSKVSLVAGLDDCPLLNQNTKGTASTCTGDSGEAGPDDRDADDDGGKQAGQARSFESSKTDEGAELQSWKGWTTADQNRERGAEEMEALPPPGRNSDSVTLNSKEMVLRSQREHGAKVRRGEQLSEENGDDR